jgi:hypothetical protein
MLISATTVEEPVSSAWNRLIYFGAYYFTGSVFVGGYISFCGVRILGVRIKEPSAEVSKLQLRSALSSSSSSSSKSEKFTLVRGKSRS